MIKGKVENSKIIIGDSITIPVEKNFSPLASDHYWFGIRPSHLYLNQQNEKDISINSKVDISEINGSETFIHFKYSRIKMVLQEVGIDSRKLGSDICAYVNPDNFFVYSVSGELLISPDQGQKRRISTMHKTMETEETT